MTFLLQSLKAKDEISLINYEELEKKFQIHKYYPKYFHNEEVSTPVIKELIHDKPIYSKANAHVKDFKNPGVLKIYETELDLTSGKLKIKKESMDADGGGYSQNEDVRRSRGELKEDRRALREEKREERKQERHERIEERRVQRRGSIADSLARLDLDTRMERKKERKRTKKELQRQLRERQKLIASKEKPFIQFKSPFDKESFLIYNNQYEDDRRSSITSKLRSIISNNSDDLSLSKISSFDQTKSVMTSGRKKKLFRKRLSEQLGMYDIFTFDF